MKTLSTACTKEEDCQVGASLSSRGVAFGSTSFVPSSFVYDYYYYYSDYHYSTVAGPIYKW